MSIRPVDLQLMMPKSVEPTRSAQNEARPDTQTQHFAAALQQRTEQNMHKATDVKQSDKREVDKDGSNKQQFERRKREQKRREAEKEKEKANIKREGSIIDFYV
jgi:hypothetical protein